MSYAGEDIHCESCGRDNPYTDEDGYTTCCNELTCGGFGVATYGLTGDRSKQVEACCWAKAEVIMDQRGIELVDGMCRVHRNTAPLAYTPAIRRW